MPDLPDNESSERPLTAEYEAKLAKELADMQAMWHSEHGAVSGLKPKQLEANDKATDDLIELRVTAYNTMLTIMEHGESESVRAGLAKFIYKEIIAWDIRNEGSDDIEALMKSLVKRAPIPIPVTDEDTDE